MREIKFRALNFGGIWFYSAKFGLSGFFDMLYPKSSTPILNRNTVGQYIELKDNNNREIHEGDIVYGFETAGGETVSYEVKYDPKEDYTWGFPTGLCNQCEIIGNIYENPELLKETKND